jgi:hypothetical protein
VSFTVNVTSRPLNPVTTGATAYRTPINPLSSSDAGSTATVAVAAHTVKTGVSGASATISYNSGSVTGLAFSTSYQIFANDPTQAGGAVTYVASTSTENYANDPAYVWVGQITTVDDGGGGGASPPPPPEFCVAAAAWVDALRQARDLLAGDEVDALGESDEPGLRRVRVESVGRVRVPSVRLITSSGVRLTCSETTPITQPGGGVARAGRALGAKAAVRDEAGLRWETIVQIEMAGLVEVARIHCGGATYAAGDQPERMMFTHNPMKP